MSGVHVRAWPLSVLGAFAVAVALALVACDPAQPKSEPAPAVSSDPAAEAPQHEEVSVGEPAAAEVPGWFDEAKIEHEAVVRKDQSEPTAVAAGISSAMVLHLKPGVTAAGCVELARVAMSEEISSLPDAEEGDDGRLSIHGETKGYSYTLVCGVAEGTPTMFLSFTR